MPWLVDAVFGHQSLHEELKDLRKKYGSPAGRTIVAEDSGVVVAGGAWRKLSDSVCELKRLYVSERARALGLGRTITRALIASAKAEGHRIMRLDTAARLTEAIALYETMGFERIAPYQTYPEPLMPHLIFMELRL